MNATLTLTAFMVGLVACAQAARVKFADDFELYATSVSFDDLSQVPGMGFAPLFSSGAVLQRDRTVAVWGICRPDEHVTLDVKDQSHTTMADSAGHWRVELDPEPAGGPFAMTLSGAQNGSVSLTNIWFGDVWLFCGQSNRAQPLGVQIANFPVEYDGVPAESDDFDDVRFAIVKQLNRASRPKGWNWMCLGLAGRRTRWRAYLLSATFLPVS